MMLNKKKKYFRVTKIQQEKPSRIKIIPRRLLDDDKPDGYLESDKDYVLNNIEAAVKLLDEAQK